MADKIEFETTIVKIDKDGDTVLSNVLYPGESIKGDGKTYDEVLKDRAEAANVSSKEMWKQRSGDPEAGDTTMTTDETVTHTVPGTVSGARPKDTDSKTAWFDYAKSKGFDGDYDDVTKANLIEQYGA